MPDEIIKELWQIKDSIAREHGYDIRALVAHLQAKKRPDGQQVVDLYSLRQAAESQRTAKSEERLIVQLAYAQLTINAS